MGLLTLDDIGQWEKKLYEDKARLKNKSFKIGGLPGNISQILTSETPQRKRLWTKHTTWQKINVELRVNIILYVVMRRNDHI